VNCPTGAIVVNKKTKKAEVDLGKCILCGLCNDVCPVKCIYFPNEFENAVTSREQLKPKKRQKTKPKKMRKKVKK
jgi:formate hydrogenlyase subunit 6/NADH:ubiquinone oxidoreductase subunit I